MSRSYSSYPFQTKWSETDSIGLLSEEGMEGTRHAASALAQSGSPSGWVRVTVSVRVRVRVRVPVRARLSCLLWGTKSLATLRDAAVVFLCRPDTAERALVLAELASFADTEQGPAALEQSRDLHPVMWWRHWGWLFPTLQPLAVRLLDTPLLRRGASAF